MTGVEQDRDLDAFLASLARQAGDGEGRPPPPVEAWNPAECGDIGLAIDKNGVWRQHGAPFTRERLVRLFSTILRKDEDEAHYLVTPHEKVIVAVEDAPFVAVRADRTGEGAAQAIALTTNVGEVFALGPQHPLRVARDAEGNPRPYALVRGRLEARLLRQPFYEIVSWAEESDGRLVALSQGTRFDLGPIA